MTPKEKAKQLVDQYEHSTYSQVQGELAKQCALIAVDEVLNALANTNTRQFEFGFYYWKQVKHEIEQL